MNVARGFKWKFSKLVISFLCKEIFCFFLLNFNDPVSISSCQNDKHLLFFKLTYLFDVTLSILF